MSGKQNKIASGIYEIVEEEYQQKLAEIEAELPHHIIKKLHNLLEIAELLSYPRGVKTI